MPSLASSAPPSPSSLQDTPLAGLGGFDLATASGMAMLRQFDARLRRMGDALTQRAAVRRLSCQAPLADRAVGLLVLPGGALALREGDSVLVCDAAAAEALQEAALLALGRLLAALPGLVSVSHGPGGLRRQAGLPPPAALQAASLLPEGRALAPLLPAAALWSGPALLRWGPGGAIAWPMRAAMPQLALGASVAGEALPPEGQPVPPEIWDAPEGDARYQLLSTGLFAHLDELLGNEVSDLLRFELVDHWTDGEDSLASQLADGLGLLPACFAMPAGQPAGLGALQAWPRAAAALALAAAPQVMLGIAAADWGAVWRPAGRQGFLRALRAALPPGSDAVLLPEDARCAPQPVGLLAADRQLRSSTADAAVLLPLPPGLRPQALLQLADRIAGACAAPVQLAVPAWGLCHRFDPAGGAELGNAAWYGHRPAAMAEAIAGAIAGALGLDEPDR